MISACTIAHLTDVHLGPISGFAPRYWNAKRLSGYLNWRYNRKSAYQRRVLDRLVEDLRAQAPDHIAVTGDLVNIGLPQEHEHAARWLAELGAPERVTVVPGNHDIYCRLSGDPGTSRWAAYMAPNGAGAAYAPADGAFPFVRVIGRVALIGLNSAVPTPPLIAWGRLGRQQLAALSRFLRQLREERLFRLVLIHHPPLAHQASRTRGLTDAADLETVLAQCGAELVIHGHNHHSTVAWHASRYGPVPIVGVPSASLGRRIGSEPLARYNLYRIGDSGAGSIEVVGRGLAEPGGPVVELERRRLHA
jgi:3',5'-cyclic AMP phosphodiesterase CpdA